MTRVPSPHQGVLLRTDFPTVLGVLRSTWELGMERAWAQVPGAFPVLSLGQPQPGLSCPSCFDTCEGSRPAVARWSLGLGFPAIQFDSAGLADRRGRGVSPRAGVPRGLVVPLLMSPGPLGQVPWQILPTEAPCPSPHPHLAGGPQRPGGCFSRHQGRWPSSGERLTSLRRPLLWLALWWKSPGVWAAAWGCGWGTGRQGAAGSGRAIRPSPGIIFKTKSRKQTAVKPPLCECPGRQVWGQGHLWAP